jgi:hypothetical protein
MIHNDEHPRCTCDRCRQTPFIDEFISHLQDYRAILRAERPEAVLVAVPFYQLGWPKAQFSFLDGRWREVSDDLRVCWWTENYPLHPLPQFLTKVEEAFEPVVFDKHPHVWHWFYMNGWSDFVFPCPEHFRSWVRRGLASGHVEAFSGESAFYRGVEWNMRALSQYTWNCELRTHDFDTLMLRSTYGNAAVAAARPLLRGYRRILSRFLTDLFQKAHRWKEAPDGAWVRTLHAVVNETQRLELDFRLHVTPARNAPGDPAYDFLLDLAILRHEAELRLHLRDGFLAWRDAEKDYARGKAEIGEACLLRSMDRIRDAQRAWFELRDARRARGVWYDQFQAAPMTKLERVFPDLLETSELTLRLRRQGYRGYRPRWKEWIEIHQWPWQEYVAFH